MYCDFGKNLRKFRVLRNMTQFDLADKTGFSRQQVANYERGTNLPTLRTASIVASVLQVSLDALAGKNGEDKTGEELLQECGYRKVYDEPEEAYLNLATPDKIIVDVKHGQVVKIDVRNPNKIPHWNQKELKACEKILQGV